MDALVAAPLAWFEDPQLDAATPLTVDDDGHVFGHVAAWGTPHVSFPGRTIIPPRSRSDYAYFNAGELATDEGDRVGVGQITLNTGHADLDLDAAAAKAHYDNTGTAVADVHAGEDAHGIWIAGAIRDNLTPGRLRELMAAKLSGDWRTIKGALEMIGSLCVNVPGFPIPRAQARVASAALTAAAAPEHMLALVASGIVMHGPTVSPEEFERKVRVLAARAGGIQALAALATDTGGKPA